MLKYLHLRYSQNNFQYATLKKYSEDIDFNWESNRAHNTVGNQVH